LALLINSCNKDNAASPGSGTQTGGQQSFTSNPNKFIVNGYTMDTINASISDEILSQNVSAINLTLNDIQGVEVNKLKFALVHLGTEVAVIDTLTKSGTTFTGTVLSDSGVTPIDQSNSPYTGVFKPQHPFSGFLNSEASGQWVLKIYNYGSLKTGVIKSWSITITYSPVLQIPSFNEAYIPVVNDITKFKICDTNGVFPGNGGANVTWDFSGLIIQPTEYTDEYVNPQISPLFWHFPQSNIAVRNFDISANGLDFYRIDQSPWSYKIFGNADSSVNGLFKSEFIPYLSIYKGTPITYNSVFIDSGLSKQIETGHNSSGKFIDTIRGDGYGTIRLPGGVSYNNALRVVTGIAGMDTINGGASITYSSHRLYSWYISGYKIPVLRMHIRIEYNTSSGGSGFKEVVYTSQNIPISKK
jgi:hypothetical protein